VFNAGSSATVIEIIEVRELIKVGELIEVRELIEILKRERFAKLYEHRVVLLIPGGIGRLGSGRPGKASSFCKRQTNDVDPFSDVRLRWLVWFDESGFGREWRKINHRFNPALEFKL
jgi:hypothetical protein